jgi:predicted lysophospholipase L1 biosynthesis ABC-type transport system permease subunit
MRSPGMDRGEEPWATVVGVVGDVRAGQLTDAFRATAYYPHRQRPPGRSLEVTWAVRSTIDAAALTTTVRRAVESVDAQVPMDIRPVERLVASSVADRKFTMLVISGFATIALLLAVIGIYGVVSYTVAQRTREIGIRLALGASPVAMLRMVVGAAMRTVVPGLALGALLTLAASGALRSMLYQMSPLEPVSLALAIGVLAVAALVSCVVPGVRATRVDPIVSMRSE